MKSIILILLTVLNVYASENSCEVIKQDVNTPVPEQLKGKQVCIKDPNTDKLDCVPTEEYKIVKRKQQFKVKEKVAKAAEPVIIEREVIKYEKVEENKNLIMLGVRRDYSQVTAKYTANQATVEYEKNLVFDLSYLRRQILDTSFGVGIGYDTNKSLRGIIGLEF